MPELPGSGVKRIRTRPARRGPVDRRGPATAGEVTAGPAIAPTPSQRIESLSASFTAHTRSAARASVPAPKRLPNWPSVMARSALRWPAKIAMKEVCPNPEQSIRRKPLASQRICERRSGARIVAMLVFSFASRLQ